MRWRVRHPKIAHAFDTLVGVWTHLDRVRTFGLAAEMAFYMFLSLVPLAAVAGLVAAKVAVHHWGSIQPQLQALPPVVGGFVQQQLASVAAWNGGAVALPAAAVFVWSASSGVQSIFEALEVQTQSERVWWKKRLLAVAACVALSVGVALLALLRTGIAWILHLIDGAVPVAADVEQSAVGSIVRVAVSLAIDFGLMAGLFAVGVPPTPDRKRLPIAPGAALAMGLQAALGWGYGVYLSTLGKADAYSGALWTIAVTMTALYFLAITILLGAELNRWLASRKQLVLPRHAPSRLHHPHLAPSRAAPQRAR